MEERTFNKFRKLVYDTSGISLGDNKVSLVNARISKRMRALQIESPNDYFQIVVADKSGRELSELLNAISTNVTHFFRESRHFDFFGKVVSEANKKNEKTMKIWCAACSTGEEPYSIAMTVFENMDNPVNVGILASDISTKVIQIAKNGVYRDQDIKNIKKDILRKYFQKGVGRADSYYRIKNHLRPLLSFKQINLSTPPFPIDGNLDVIFCRNVMIYFNEELRTNLIRNFHSLLIPGGILIVGLAESLSVKGKGFDNIEPSVYQKK